MLPRGTMLMVTHSVTGLPVTYRIPAAIASTPAQAWLALAQPNWCDVARAVAWHRAADELALAWALPLIMHGEIPPEYPWGAYAAPSAALMRWRRLIAHAPRVNNWTESRMLALHASVVGLGAAAPNAWRTTPVWLGATSVHSSEMVPPPASAVPKLMHDWVEFLGRDDLDRGAQALVGFVQLLAIHPFRDGNGRVARALLFRLAGDAGVPAGMVALALAGLARRKHELHRAIMGMHHGDVSVLAALSHAVQRAALDLAEQVLALRRDLDALAQTADRGGARMLDALIELPEHTTAALAQAAALSLPRARTVLERLHAMQLVDCSAGTPGAIRWSFSHLRGEWRRLHAVLLAGYAPTRHCA